MKKKIVIALHKVKRKIPEPLELLRLAAGLDK